MGIVSSKDVVLGKIRNALSKKSFKVITKPDFNQPLYNTSEEDLAVLFAENLINTQAKFFFCETINDFKAQLQRLLNEKRYKNIAAFEKDLISILPGSPKSYSTTMQGLMKADVGISLCESLIARLGSVIVSSKQLAGRGLSIYPPASIIVGYSSQLVLDIKDGLKRIQEKYKADIPSMISLTTGPSRTADIEKTLVLGAHGPKELIVFLIDDSAGL